VAGVLVVVEVVTPGEEAGTDARTGGTDVGTIPFVFE